MLLSGKVNDAFVVYRRTNMNIIRDESHTAGQEPANFSIETLNYCCPGKTMHSVELVSLVISPFGGR